MKCRDYILSPESINLQKALREIFLQNGNDKSLSLKGDFKRNTMSVSCSKIIIPSVCQFILNETQSFGTEAVSPQI